MSANSLAAYQRGATGAGIIVGVIDSGIDLQSAEFGTRISAASASTANNGTIDDESGHGTAVAFTIAGRRNDAGTHGIAFDSTLLVLRTDTPGSCAGTTPSGSATTSGCTHSDRNIAAAIDLAVTNRAKVINISLGGSAGTNTFLQAVDRATAAGIIIVISAGNDGAMNPDAFAAVATNAAVARGLVIIAGSVGTSDVISSSSNQAGTGANFFLTAVGERVRAPNQENVPFLWSGTSFSAPQISGAVALLAQAFPNLSGTQIVDILYRSARDAGATGIDAVYGRGILDLTSAFAPIGQTSLAGSRVPVSLVRNGATSAPMGDAKQGPLGTAIQDSFGRAYSLNLARTLTAAPIQRMLTGALTGYQRNYSVSAGSSAIAVTIAPGRERPEVERLLLAPGDADVARTLAATITSKLGSKARFAIGFSQSASAMTAQLAGRSDPAFLIAPDPAQTQGFASTTAASVAVRRDLGKFGLTVAAENGAVLAPGLELLAGQQTRMQQSRYDRMSVALDRRFGALFTSLNATHLRERDTVLGARFGDGLGAAQANSWFIDAAARVDFGAGWSIGGTWRQGWTMAHARAGLDGSGLIGTTAFAADIGKRNFLFGGDSMGLRVSQPLRLTRGGGIDLRLPAFFDYGTNSVSSFATQRLNLAPTGREIDLEARYGLPLWGGAFQTNLYLRRDPGNVATFSDDYGIAFRFSKEF
ncbi:S8 family peptidase [Sphingomonas sp. 28-62-11]|uniref:S8 family peptidase n=1 Tax=Sphingomonas sp. 28-62-11 TaxID=1970432 RepID=UPI0035A97E53